MDRKRRPPKRRSAEAKALGSRLYRPRVVPNRRAKMLEVLAKAGAQQCRGLTTKDVLDQMNKIRDWPKEVTLDIPRPVR